ncbi:DUF1127 domain-containing protein [Rhizobiaceae bacterium n13]|uniref:DUF1127 domain-containing protein n=1 Tax=Ferirhizobium litorale TaxID=2927786 RepID=A0AAE3QBT5_9HYPH|nr:DUF1127 domain-containing protein [Fererhizobium litorale]MDI7864659.1 DUF1127 domain-containing protein [Fererhizobium litorale]MDI7922150.1 DUF1127 domain-containing protein [Fererhizobium litorale]
MFATYFLSRIRAHRRYRQTVRELAQYTDHQLRDVGITRFDIEAIARRQF